jgi:putative ABC transport system permease protein
VKEFPTAPKDSFFIANQTYIAAVTHDHSVGAYLVDTGGAHRVAVAQRARALVGPLATVTDLTHTRHVIASSLTAVDLQGLTKIELAFALALAASSTGLALWLGFAERRRMFAIATAIGARRRQVGAFVWAESAFVAIFGLVAGTVGAVVLANMLVKVLTGVFDPPPSALAIPWLYLGTALFLALAATVVAALAAIRQAAGAKVEVLREL